MSTPPIKSWLERDGRLLRLRLACPKANVIDAEMTAALTTEFTRHRAHHGLAAVREDLVERVRAKLTRVEEKYLESLMVTHDAVEGLNAFIEKRAANWEHR